MMTLLNNLYKISYHDSNYLLLSQYILYYLLTKLLFIYYIFFNFCIYYLKDL